MPTPEQTRRHSEWGFKVFGARAQMDRAPAGPTETVAEYLERGGALTVCAPGPVPDLDKGGRVVRCAWSCSAVHWGEVL